MTMQFLEPWMPVGAGAPQLEKELAAELGTSHPLKGRDMRAVAVRQDRDDVLFVQRGSSQSGCSHPSHVREQT